MEVERSPFWAGRKTAIAFGVFTLAFWLSRAVFPLPLPPLAPMPNFGGLVTKTNSAAPWIQRQTALYATPAEELVRSLQREYVTVIAMRWGEIILGAMSGVLVARGRRAGRWLAVSLCAVLLARFLFAQAGLAQQGHFVGYWRAYGEHSPRLVIEGFAVLLFYVGTLAYLTRPRVATQFSTG